MLYNKLKFGRFKPSLLSSWKTPQFLFLDTFTDTDGTALSAHTPDYDGVGNGWICSGGTDEIQDNKLTNQSSTAGDNVTCLVDVETGDCIVAADVVPTAAWGMLFVRYSDSSNNWRVRLETDANSFILQKIEAGVLTSVTSTSVTITAGESYGVVVVLSGNVITAYLNGENKISFTSPFLNDQTSFGAFIDNIDSNAGAIDNFKIKG